MTPIPNIEIARDFLRAIDSSARAFTFQTYDDDKVRADPKLAKTLHGTLDEVWPALVRLNSAGAAVAYCVNATDLKGRGLANIKRVRALWCEADTAEPRKFPIPPDVIVESSPGKWHFYWLVNGITPEQFTAAMDLMCSAYASDTAAKDITRVLRLPGTLNQKPQLPQPHLVQFHLKKESN